jgi:hypothetical protein
MEWSTLSLNVSTVAILLNGSVGVIHIFVNLAINVKMREIMYQERNRMNYLNVQE